ncbi:MAG: DUF615 domain-containing protein [Gammaproteobacteria bacterium]|nr:MAG: DUF615 domain-containing protein [Gammaproteobacteria bacterium]
MGEKLINLPARDLKKIPLTAELEEAIELAHKIENKRGALKRQRQFIGKLLRKTDTEEISEALKKIEGQHDQENAKFHRLEKLRDQLIEEGDSAIGNIAEHYPNLDRQHIRQLVRKAQQERKAMLECKQNANKGSAKALFKYLKEISE